MYKEEDIRNEETNNYETKSTDENEATHASLVSFSCDECPFSSASQRVLSVHIGVKHKKSMQ